MGIIAELVRRGLVVLLVVLVAMRVVCAELVPIGTNPRPSPARPPCGLELRTIKRLPAGRIFALRLQVVIA